jgi:uncharacterized membrane protein YphA (DoxX/SURF4 family)
MTVESRSRLRTIGYWVTTVLVAMEMALGGVWDLLHTRYVRTIMDHLGYPEYFVTILGVWKLLGTAAMLAPRWPRLREWAYAGMFFLYSGAVASHSFAGDGPARWAGALIFGTLLVISWRLMPAAEGPGVSWGGQAVTREARQSSSL